jgi:hypothetical protein
VPERPVADVVEQARHPQQLFQQRRRGPVREDRVQRRIELLREPSREVHGAERVLEPAVLGRGEDPARGLELGNAAQALHPRGVDDVLLGRLARDAARARVEDVLMDGICDETAPLIRIGGALHDEELIP